MTKLREPSFSSMKAMAEGATQEFASQTRYVCVLDVLGFSNVVCGGTEPLRKLVYHVHMAGMVAQVAADLGSRLVRHDGTPVRVHMQRFSDTYVLFSDRADPVDLEAVVEVSSSMLSGQALTGFLLRGAIVKGELYVHNDLSVIIGKGLVEAHNLEKRQAWGGVVVDRNRLDSSDELDLIADLEDRGWLMEWEVPMKEGPAEKHLAVGWSFWLPDEEAFLRHEVEQRTPAINDYHRGIQEATWHFYNAHLQKFPRLPGPSDGEMVPAEREHLARSKDRIAQEQEEVHELMKHHSMSAVELYFLVKYPNSTALTGMLKFSKNELAQSVLTSPKEGQGRGSGEKNETRNADRDA